MIPSLRQWFNSSWSPEKYSRFLRLLEQRFGEPPPFVHSETPCFLPADLVGRAATAGREIVDQVLGNPEHFRNAVPEEERVPNEDPVPLFVQADFGLDTEGNLKLVEIQGFPSLYAYQLALADAYREAYGIDNHLADLPNSLTRDHYVALLKNAIVADHDPENVVLLEVDPANQKTRHDFQATEEMLGISVVDACRVIKKGKQLLYDKNGTVTPIKRIYNRVIVDELQRRGIELPFDFRGDLHVEWAGHPNWFYRLSKFSLPFVNHPTVPKAFFLDKFPYEKPLENWVLKPLYSFAGTGVVVGPTAEDLAQIPVERRHDYIMQERVPFSPWIETPDGPTKLEIRVMYIWTDSLQPVNLIIRMGRGAQMGVDHNKGFRWVGASAAFISSGDDK